MLQTIDKIKEYENDPSAIPGYSMLDTGTGWMAQMPKLGGQKGYGLQALQRQLAQQAKVTSFQDLKEASVNGSSGFSRAAVVEFNAIGDKIATVDPVQGKEDYIANLDKLANWATATKQGLARAAGISPGETQSGPTETTAEKTPNVQDAGLNAPPVAGANQMNVGPNARFITQYNPSGKPPSAEKIQTLGNTPMIPRPARSLISIMAQEQQIGCCEEVNSA